MHWILFTSRCYAERGYAISTVCRLSVWLSVRIWRWGMFFTQVGILWWQFGSIYTQIFLVRSVKLYFLQECVLAVQGHPRSLILAPIESAYACDFLLVRHSNLGHILHRFGDIAGFCAHDPTPIPPSFGGCSRCTRSPMLGSVRARTLRNSAVLKLLSKNSNLCDHGIWTLQTERRTDGRTTYCGIAALCVASRCKNWSIYDENMEEHPVFFSDLCLDTFKIGFTSFHFFGFSRCSRNWGQKVTMSPRTTLH